jgi:hypothetical protein
MSVANAFGGGKTASKTRLVADLNAEYQKLNTTLEKTEKLSKSIAQSLKNSGGGGGSSTGASSMDFGSNAGGKPSSGAGSSIVASNGGGGWGDFSKNAPSASSMGFKSAGFSMSKTLGSMAMTAVTASAQAVDPSDYIVNDIARRRFGFMSGKYGATAGSMSFQSMMNGGTSISSMDAANAAMSGASMGIMPGLSNYKGIGNSVASLSNLVPGAGLEASMGAVASLNQGSSVNKLRMIGINVRDNNGYMRDIESIAKDLWKTISANKTGKSAISQQDLSYSLQPGMSLDMLLNQYFNGDPVLREGIVSYLYQFASGQGTDKAHLLSTGANPGITQSISRRNASGYALQNAVTGAGIEGIQKANDELSILSDTMATLNPAFSSLRDAFVAGNTYTQTMAGAGNGAGGTMLSNPVLIAAAALLGIPALATSGSTMSGIQKTGSDVLPNSALAQSGLIPNGKGNTTPKASGTIKSSDLINQDKHTPGFAQSTDSIISWAGKLIKRLGGTPNRENISAVLGWVQGESTSKNNWQTWNNPLNATIQNGDYNALSKNGAGVKEYANEDQSIAATAMMLEQSNFKGIHDDLVNGVNRRQTFRDIAASQWGTTSVGNVTINVDGSKTPAETAKAIADYLKNPDLYVQQHRTN